MNLGKMRRDDLIKAARRFGVSEAQLMRALRENPTLVARYGATYSAFSRSK